MVIGFYESGELNYISLWEQTKVTIPTKYGNLVTDFGFELYKDGKLKSMEPIMGTMIIKDGEEVPVFRFFRTPFHAKDNYLKFDTDGNIL